MSFINQMRPKQRRRILWSELPTELLLIIANNLVSRNDLINFRRVCKSWRHSAPLSLLNSKPTLSPIFPHTIEVSTSHYSRRRRSIILVANSLFLVKPKVNSKLKVKPWLLSVEESNRGILSVRSPLSRIVASDLPDRFPQQLNWSNFDALELGNFHLYKYFDQPYVNDDDDDEDMVASPRSWKPYMPFGEKVVLFPNPNCDASSLTIDECSVVELTDEVAVGVRRLSDNVEKQVYFRGRKLDDIIHFKGEIYGIDRKGRVCSMDYDKLKVDIVTENSLCEGSGSDNRKRLAVWGDELYLVYTWWRRQRQLYKVFRLNEEEAKWDKLDGIGDDRILFVTFDGCFFAPTKDFPSPWRGNCIVSVKGSFSAYKHGFSYRRSQCFEGVSDSICVFHFKGGDSGRLGNVPGYSDVLWPPPSWLWMDPCEIEEEDEEDENEEDEDEQLEGGGETEQQQQQQEITENHVHAAKGTHNVQEDIPSTL